MKKLCPKCKVELHLVLACPSGWSDEYLICPICYGTFNIEETDSYLREKNLDG